MSEPFKVSKTTAIVDVVAVFPGAPPAVRVVYHAENSSGVARRFVRQVPVPDAALFQRIQSSVSEGDQIEAITVNEWYDTGYVSYLADFKKAPDIEPEAVAKNGVFNLVQNDIAQITIPPARNSRAKVQH